MRSGYRFYEERLLHTRGPWHCPMAGFEGEGGVCGWMRRKAGRLTRTPPLPLSLLCSHTDLGVPCTISAHLCFFGTSVQTTSTTRISIATRLRLQCFFVYYMEISRVGTMPDSSLSRIRQRSLQSLHWLLTWLWVHMPAPPHPQSRFRCLMRLCSQIPPAVLTGAHDAVMLADAGAPAVLADAPLAVNSLLLGHAAPHRPPPLFLLAAALGESVKKAKMPYIGIFAVANPPIVGVTLPPPPCPCGNLHQAVVSAGGRVWGWERGCWG